MLFKGRRNNKPRKPAGRIGPSIITSEVVIEGNLLTGGELQIDGTVNGDVRARSAVIDVQGIVHGQVVAEDVFVRGRIIGPIRGVHVNIYAGAHVEGDVVNETLSIENGAYVDGKIQRSDDPMGDSGAYPQNYEDGGQQFGVYDDEGFRPVDVQGNRGKAAE